MEHLFEGGAESGSGHFNFSFQSFEQNFGRRKIQFDFALLTAASMIGARSPRSQAAFISFSEKPPRRPNSTKGAQASAGLFHRAISIREGSAFWRSSERNAGSRFSVSLDNAHEDLLRSIHSIEFNIFMKGRVGILICRSVV